jgi:hypothetical protein
MGVHCYAYKLNAEKIRFNLVTALNDQLFKPSFSEYLNAQKEEMGRSIYKNNQVIESLELSKILFALEDLENYATATYLGIILDWLSNLDEMGYFKKDEADDIYSFYGFEEIFDARGRSMCWVYGNQIYSFVYHNNLKNPENYDGRYTLLSNTVYKCYLTYLLTVLKAICLDKEYPDNPFNRYRDSVVTDFELPNDYQEQATLELVDIREENLREDSEEKTDSNYRRSSSACHYRVADQLFYDIVELRKRLEGYQGKILDYYS